MSGIITNFKAIDIKCPECGKLANFEEPFEFYSSRDAKTLESEETRPFHHWSSWIVVELFPSQFEWKAPSGSAYLRSGGDNGESGYPFLTFGLFRCPSCHSSHKHKLQWLQDAYWQWEIRGEILWAWNKDHAQKILSYIDMDLRPSRSSSSLRCIPTHFLTSKIREIVKKKMQQSINV